MRRMAFSLAVLLTLSFTLPLTGLAETPDNRPDAPTPKIAPDPQSEQDPAGAPTSTAAPVVVARDHTKDEVPKRIFFIIPNFMTANDQPENRGPLTPKQKFDIAWHQFADVSA